MTVMGSDPAWTVTGQLPTDGEDVDGNFGRGVQISFTTAGGVKDRLFVLNADHTPDRVRQLIQAVVDNHNAVGALTG